MRLLSLAFVLLASAMAPRALAQLVVELPFDPGEPAREIRSHEWVGPDLRAGRQSAPSSSSPQRVHAPKARPEVGPYLAADPSSSSLSFLLPPPPPPPATITLSNFDGGATDGSIRTGSTWVGNVTQGAGYITIGGSARDDNGWGRTGLALDATGMSAITITAQREVGNAAGSLFLQFEDRFSIPHTFSLSTSLFAVGSPSTAQIIIGVWSSDFDFTQIGSWSIGGGGLGTNDLRLSLHHLEFTTTAIPEPSTYAALAGAATLIATGIRRRRLATPKH